MAGVLEAFWLALAGVVAGWVLGVLIWAAL
jgi:hypothetical protein